MATLTLTIAETLRYRGKIGQWSWALHRISGLGTLLFLFLHVIDTSWAVFYPDLYKDAIAQYQSPLFTIGEFALVACVIYHALNGFRIVVFDARPQWWDKQERAAQIVLGATIVLMVPTFVLMFGHVIAHYSEVPFDLGLAAIISTQSKFLAGIIAIIVLGLVVSAVYSLVPGANADKKVLKRSTFDSFMWSFMRISGVIIIPLVFGHLAMMHVIQGVFDITTQGHSIVGTNFEATGRAADFVLLRWQYVFAGVFIWRIYDILMLALVVIHGFNGMRYVINDYVHNKFVNRGFRFAILGTVIGLLIVGGLATIESVPSTTNQIVNNPGSINQTQIK
jgi:succinate dehydrogenase / fumarate reductase cytochrome b subunit